MLVTLDSSTITVGSDQDFTTKFSTYINLKDGQYEVALLRASIWYSWFNISAAYGNTQFRYFNGSVFKTINILPGNYSIEDLNTFIQGELEAAGDWDSVNEVHFITITPNYNTSRVQVALSGGYQVDFATGNLHQLLGFSNVLITSTQFGSTIGDITNGINSVLIRCSIVDGSYQNGSLSDIIYSFVPSSPPSSLINIEPFQRVYLPINTTQIADIRMRITDQLGNLIDLNGEPVTYLLHIRKADPKF